MVVCPTYTLPRCFCRIIQYRKRQLWEESKTHWRDESYCRQAVAAALKTAESVEAGDRDVQDELKGKYAALLPKLPIVVITSPVPPLSPMIPVPSPEKIRTYAEYMQKTPCRLPYRKKRTQVLLELLFYAEPGKTR